MRADEKDSVTGWIRGLGTPRHEDASRQLWDRYFERLARLARGRLRGGLGGPVDGEDVALSVFDSFFRGAADGRFDRLDGRDDLWRLLVTIAARKAHNAGRDELRLKRGGEAARLDGDILDTIPDREPTPEFAVQVEEDTCKLLASLANDSHRAVVRLKLEGSTNAEIARSLGCGLRTVERKLEVVRKRWLAEEGDL